MSGPGLALDYRRRLPRADAFAERARAALAGGATHDSWAMEPFAPAFVAADGPYKWDIDGHRYIDFWSGHGSLLLGHRHPGVEAAVQAELASGTHLGGLTLIAVEWAEAVQHLIPSAERVRFTASGSEAAQLALRVARAFTGRPCVIRLDGHYHGWHDQLLLGLPGIDQVSAGLAGAGGESVFCCHPEDIEALENRLAGGDVAAIILEPGGGSSGLLGWSVAWLNGLHDLAERYGSLLVFDEVISGFRYAPGGVQSLAGVRPDLTILAKIMSGGLPGGALVGRAEPMAVFGEGISRPLGRARVTHAGTFNGFTLSAAAGLATLGLIEDGEAQAKAERAAQRLCLGVTTAAARLEVDAALFRNSSTVHLIFGAGEAGIAAEPSAEAFGCVARSGAIYQAARRALLVHGIDMHPTHGWASAAHSDEVIDDAVARFGLALADLAPKLQSCTTTCPNRHCACRLRTFAGCDLPIADLDEIESR